MRDLFCKFSLLAWNLLITNLQSWTVAVGSEFGGHHAFNGGSSVLKVGIMAPELYFSLGANVKAECHAIPKACTGRVWSIEREPNLTFSEYVCSGCEWTMLTIKEMNMKIKIGFLIISYG